jgi:hypothetical protein
MEVVAKTLGASSFHRQSFVQSLCRYTLPGHQDYSTCPMYVGVWKLVVLHKISGSHSVKPQKTEAVSLIFGTWPYRPVWLVKK